MERPDLAESYVGVINYQFAVSKWGTINFSQFTHACNALSNPLDALTFHVSTRVFLVFFFLFFITPTLQDSLDLIPKPFFTLLSLKHKQVRTHALIFMDQFEVDQSLSLSSSSSSSSCLCQPPPCSPRNSPNSPSQASSVLVLSSRLSHKRKAGRKKFKETRHPIYRGVRQRNGEKWVCEVREPNKKTRIWVGTFPSPEMAARAHDVAALALQGSLAVLNFVDSAWLVPRAESSTPKDIQAAAYTLLRGKMCSQEKVLEASLVNVHCPELDVLCGEGSEEVPKQPRTTLFLDEEALFNMPGLLDSMAEGLILTPPAMRRGFDWDDWAEGDMDLPLWD